MASFPTPSYALLGVDVGGISIDIGDLANEAADAIENRYHMDTGAIQNYGEGFNVSSNKGNIPEVSLVFSPSDPREGERLTAKAFPTFFSNPTEQLYYTWYLKREGCDLGGADGKPEYCNADGEGDITVNDWKVAAMRLVVTDGADPAGFEYDQDDDSDGYEAKYGGEMEVNVGDNHKWCYVQDAETGKRFEFRDGCFHLFPNPGSEETGDGDFGLEEESFWGSNPHDPDTADNGNKDEANAVGVGVDSFTWNYQVGDKVGVVVEGTSMFPTQHDDSSYAIMFALSQNIRPRLSGSLHGYVEGLCSGGGASGSSSGDETCSIKSLGSRTERINGYDVCFMTADMDAGEFDECLEANLVDPLEGGQGSSKKLELSLSASPQNPTNDREEGIAGDVVGVYASIDNSAKASNEVKYSWEVSLSDNMVDGFQTATEQLTDQGLVSSFEGNGLDSFRVTLNMDAELLDAVGGFSDADPLYMKISVRAEENYGGLVARTGTSDVIVRIANTDKRIAAYATDIVVDSSGTPKLSGKTDAICDEYHVEPTSAGEMSANADRIACRLIGNEIIALLVDPEGLKDFRWTINGADLGCSEQVSDDSACLVGNEVFFAAAGNPGEMYSIRMDAVDIESGKSVSLSRFFQIVDPEIVIEATDPDLAWPRYVGSFSELDGSVVPEYSDEVFETYDDSPIAFQVRTIPGYVASRLTLPEWTIDGVSIDSTYDTATGTFPIRYVPAEPKEAGESYFVGFSAMHAYPEAYRLALERIFGIDVLKTSDEPLSREIRTNVIPREPFAQADGPERFFATVSRYVPPFALLAFRMFATAALILFTVGFVFSLMPESPSMAPKRRRYDS